MTMPGTRWVAVRGPHKGSEIEVVKISTGGSVQIRHVGGGGDSWSNAKSEASGLAMLNRDAFLANFTQKDQLVAGDTHGGRSFRRNGARQQSLDTVAGEAAVALDKPKRAAPKEMILELMTVTPELARGWLDRGGANRKLVPNRVETYAAAMRRGEWQVTGDTIKLDSESRVRDGQHRLEAIFQSGIPIQTWVARNVPEAAFDVMDIGRSRTAADLLGMHGVASKNETASAARGLIVIERFGRLYVSQRDTAARPSAKEQLDYALGHPELEQTVRLASALSRSGFIGGGGLWATALTLLYRIDVEATEQFVEHLVEGDNLSRDSSILKLRNMFRANYVKWDNSAKGRESLLALVIKGWNLWRRGEGVSQLRWRGEGASPEAFPVPE